MNTNVLCQLKALWQTAFHDSDEAIDSFFATGFSPDRCHYLTENSRVVSALYWFDCEFEGGKLAYIYAVATDPCYQGRGLASQLLQQTHTILKKQGYSGAVLKPAPGLFPFYQKLGYETCGYIRKFTASAGKPIALTELTIDEFAAQRRALLPDNAIIQEGATLNYLHTYARFYASDKTLLCVCREEPVIFEYLGDPDSAPSILAALGIQTAQIPTVGFDTPFVMHYPINCTKTPGYLGLSLE